MDTHQIGALTRLYTEEDDQSFIPDADLVTMLQAGYARFRRRVTSTDPAFWHARANISPTTDNYDLAGGANPTRILGASLAPAGTLRMSRLLKVADIDAAGAINFWLHGAASIEEMDSRGSRWFLEGTVLRFTTDQNSRTLRLHYAPVSGVDWTDQAAPGAFVDDLEEFHSLIALYAAEEYAVRDGGESPVHERLRQKLEDDLGMWLIAGRAPEQADHVVRDGRGGVGGIW